MTDGVNDIGELRRFAADVGAALPALRRDTPAATAVLDRMRRGDRPGPARSAPTEPGRSRRVLRGQVPAARVLVGDATLLPAGAVPTTGNVTALHLLPAAHGEPTGVRSVSITLLSRSAAAELVEHLIGSIVGLVERYGLPYPVDLIQGPARPTTPTAGGASTSSAVRCGR